MLCFEGFRCHILQPTARISLRHNYTTHMTLATLTLTRSVARVVRARTATASERRSPLAPTSDATLLISGPLAKPLCPHHLSLTRCHRQRRRRYGRGLIAAAWTSKRNSVDVVVAWFVHSGPLTSNSGLLLLLATPRATPECTGNWAELLPASAQAVFDEPSKIVQEMRCTPT